MREREMYGEGETDKEFPILAAAAEEIIESLLTQKKANNVRIMLNVNNNSIFRDSRTMLM